MTLVVTTAVACSSSASLNTRDVEPDSSTTCTPGTTLECAGPGNCQGGQVCNPQGTGYGRCDCGTGGTGGTGGSAGAVGGTGAGGAADAGGGTAGESGPDAGIADSDGDAATTDSGEIPDVDGGSPATVTFGENATDTYRGVTDDTFVDADFPTTVNGAASRLDVDGIPAQNVLLRFDVSAIPATVTIQSVTLHLTEMTDVTSDTFRIYAVVESWNEVDATWNEREPSTPWTNPGCMPPGSSATTILGEVVPDTPSTTYGIAISPSVVQSWVDGSVANHGVVMRMAGGGSDGAHFASSESGSSPRPSLEVTYTE